SGEQSSRVIGRPIDLNRLRADRVTHKERRLGEPPRGDSDISLAPDSMKHKWRDGAAGDGIAIKILRPGIVVAIQIILKERRHRPDDDRSEDRGVAFREIGAAA